jgi:peptidoglycan/LPS O-acetylase OafA/YrhL
MTHAIDTSAATPPRRLGYQPALDGARAIAISLVVLFHYPWKHPTLSNPVHGGFLGVDAFFVLSGFLITTLLLQEHATRGSVSLHRFYARLVEAPMLRRKRHFEPSVPAPSP